MTPLEEAIVQFLTSAAAVVAPIFIHSSRGALIFNASDELVSALAQMAANPPAATAPSAAVAPAVAQ